MKYLNVLFVRPFSLSARQVNCSTHCVNFPVGHTSLKIKNHQRTLPFKQSHEKISRAFKVLTWLAQSASIRIRSSQLAFRICNLREFSGTQVVVASVYNYLAIFCEGTSLESRETSFICGRQLVSFSH